MPDAKPKKLTEIHADRFVVADRVFTWTTDEGEKVRIPMKVPMSALIKHEKALDDGRVWMFEFLADLCDDDAVVTMREQDGNDLEVMFYVWQMTYLGGASLGELEASSS